MLFITSLSKGKWKDKESEQKNIEFEILKLADQALLIALREFVKDPKNKDMQSLKGMLKEFLDRKKPAKEYLDYVVKFQEQFKDYCMKNSYLELWEEYRKIGIDFTDYLRIVNG